MLRSLLSSLRSQPEQPARGEGPLRLNVGCGRNILPGWINLDRMALPGIDLVADLERCAEVPLPLASGSVGEFLLSHVLEHIHAPLPLMQELWRVAAPDATMTVRVPYGASDDAWEDPTHVRPQFPNSFAYFAQPCYWRADYGYRGDWQAERVELHLPREKAGEAGPQALFERIMGERNLVVEMVAHLRCVKPMRPPEQALLQAPAIEIVRV